MNLKLSLTASVILGEAKEVYPQTKQQFFSTRKSQRRGKGSRISQEENKSTISSQAQVNNSPYQIIKTLQSLDIKQLHHSLAETQEPDVLLEFKVKQPKRKKIPSKIFNSQQSKQPQEENQKQTPFNIEEPTNQNKIKNSFILQANHTNKKQNDNSQIYSNGGQNKNEQIIPNQAQTMIKKTITSLFADKVTQVQERYIEDISINDFIIVKQIGDGTYSKVFQAIHKKTGFACALKILQKKLMKQLNVQQNAIRQIKILSCLSSHPNIVSLYGSFTDQYYIYLVLQVCTEGDVQKKLKQSASKEQVNQKNKSKQHNEMLQTVYMLKQICEALKELHENSIIHRDIKPQNILVTMGNNIKLSDFGWSVHNPKNNLRKTLCGTPLYLAPEFIISCLYNDSIDIWSLGIMTYQLFAKQFPFKIENVNDLMKIAEEQIDFSRIKCPLAKDFCKKALVKDRHYRADIWQLLEHQLFEQYKYIE